MIKTVIFDFDGVLVESVDIKTKAFARLFEDEGPDIVKKVVDHHLLNGGVSRFDKFRYIYKNFLGRELSEAAFRDLCCRFSALVTEEVVRAPYVKGAKEFLDRNKERYELFVASGTPQDEIVEIINKRGMASYFAAIYGSPSPKDLIVRNILRSSVGRKEEAVLIGDALSDYEAAEANGIRFIARVMEGDTLFNDIECLKIADLDRLGPILEGSSEHK